MTEVAGGNSSTLADADDYNSNNNNNNQQYNDDQILLDTFVVYGSILVLVAFTFCWVRRAYPHVFLLRQYYTHLQSPCAQHSFGFLSWMYHVNHAFRDDEIRQTSGMDALCFLRLHQMGYKLALVGSLNALVLAAVYATAPEATDTEWIDQKVLHITIAHVPFQSKRFIATTLTAYIFFGYTMYLILQDLQWFTAQRHAFKCQATPRNYAVLVRNIPAQFDNNQALATFMAFCFAPQRVVQASVIFTARRVAQTLAARATALHNLQHALAAYQVYGTRPLHLPVLQVQTVGKTPVLGNKMVDSIQTYKQELIALNRQVNEEMDWLETRIEACNTTPEFTLENDQENAGHEQQNGDKDEDQEEDAPLVDGPGHSEEGQRPKIKDVLRVGAVSNLGGAAVDKVGTALNTAGQLATDAAQDALHLLTGVQDGIAYSSGFVVFNNLATANAAQQMVSYDTPYRMQISEAPDPDDINWYNIGRTHKDLQAGRLVAVSISVVICLFWTIPVSFIASISSLEGLRSEFEFIDDMLDATPFLEPLFAVLAPLLLVAANTLLRYILKLVTKLEGPISGAALESSLFLKMAAFMVIQSFFISAISGSLVDKLAEMIETPAVIVETLASALPAEATYFLQFTFVSTVSTVAFEGLRLYPIGMAIVRSFIGPRLTEKEKQTTYLGIAPICNPARFMHAYHTSMLVLYFMVLFVYSVISPLINFVLAFVFLALGTLFRHQFIYVYPIASDSGGKIWMGFIKTITSCMIVAEFTILGLLSLKKAYIASPMFVPLLIITILFSYYLRQEHFHTAEFLPIRSCLRTDSKVSDLDFLKGSYLQPELKADRHVWPNDLSEADEKALEELDSQSEGMEINFDVESIDEKVDGELETGQPEEMVLEVEEAP